MTSSLIDTNKIRQLGIIGFIFFSLLFGLAIYKENNLTQYIFGSLTLLCMGFIIIPNFLRPIYLGWIKIAHFIGTINTIIILTLFYYIIITPVAILKLCFGGRPLPLKFNKKQLSYWIKRSTPVQPREKFNKRY